MSLRPTRFNVRAFSLIELLIVIVIIGIIIALVVPAVGQVRNKARSVEARNLVASLQQAGGAYRLDKRKSPGYFTAGEMGSDDNRQSGFSGMQNVLLDLMGGVTDQAADPANNRFLVGPSRDDDKRVVVDLVLLGAGKAYFSPNQKFLQVQDGQTGGSRGIAGGDNDKIPEIVDNFGNPVLAWTALATKREIDGIDDMAAETSSGGVVSRFYWNENATFLNANATSVGRSRVNQGAVGGRSMLGEWNGAKRFTTMAAMLGNPNSPNVSTLPATPAAEVDLDSVLPTQPRGSTVFQSAGADGVYLSRAEKGAPILSAGPESWIEYAQNFLAASSSSRGALYPNTGSGPSSTDVLAKFDDLIIAGE